MNEDLIRSVCRERNLANITYLNLFNNKIKKIQGLSQLRNLKTLVLSFNEIEDIEDLQACSQLTKLDLHNNFIRQIKNLEGKDQMGYLDLTHNWIADWNQVEHIREYCPNLKELGLRCNPIATKQSYRAQVYKRMGHLSKLDGASYSDKDKERVENELRPLTIAMILDSVKDQRKNLFEVPAPSTDSPGRPGEDHDEDGRGDLPPVAKYEPAERKANWEKLIEILNLAHQGISQLCALEPFVNLKKLNLMDNDIAKIQGLEQCKLLEELSLEKNKI